MTGMRSNRAMQELLLCYDVDEGQTYTLDPTLLSLLSSGIRVIDGAYVFAELETSVSAPRSQFGTLTGYERAVNHFHLDDSLPPPENETPRALLTNGISFMRRLKRELALKFPGIPSTIVFSYSTNPLLSCVLRFYKIRGDEDLLDDLEAYAPDAIMVLDLPVAP